MIRSVTISELSAYMRYLTSLSESSVRQWLAAYARDHGIIV
jgi:DNA-binding transcriptional ArsR family regulator